MLNKKNYFFYLLIIIFFFKTFNYNNNDKFYKITTYNVLWLFKDFDMIPASISNDIINNNFHKNYDHKINLLSDELKLLDSDIFFFQEIQNIDVLNDINQKLNYSYTPLIQLDSLARKLPLHTACLFKKNLNISIVNNSFTQNFGRLMHIVENNYNFNFINLHLISSKENTAQRLKQLTDINDYIQNISKLIILGDFNDIDINYYYTPPKFLSYFWKFLPDDKLDSALTILTNQNKFTNIFKFYNSPNIYTHCKSNKLSENNLVNFNKLQTLDYIFLDNDILFYNINITLLNDLNKNQIIQNIWISDHRSVTVSFNFS